MADTDLRARVRAVLIESGFLPEFSPAALAEAARASLPSGSARDRRAEPWSSIDNPSSLDLDQLEWAERLGANRVRLHVAIADVDALAPAGGAIDGHAGSNTTSIYAGVATYPMIPERLSTDLTSLHEARDRLAVVISLDVADDGSTSNNVRAECALVRNHARLAYDDVAEFLDGRPRGRLATDGALAAQLSQQHTTAGWLRARRRRAGALEFETRQLEIHQGAGGVALAESRDNPARDLIEDVMLATNAAIAGLCESAGVSWIRRAVRSPERWERIAALAHEVGHTLPAAPSSPALAAFLDARRRADPGGFADLSLAVVKLIGKGEYLVERKGEDLEGHFGLALGDYTHGTAPNRRYADLVTQRLVKAALANAPAPYDDTALAAIAAHCTEREDQARRAERQVRKMAAAAWVLPRVGQLFDAVVTGAAKKGTFARLKSPPVEGRIMRGEAGLDVGDRIRVRLISADPDRGFIDFARA